MRTRLLGVICVLLLAFVSAAASAQIRIGMGGPISGANAPFGEQMRRGAQMALDEINAAGGVNGQKLEMLVGDTTCEAVEAAAVARTMVAYKAVFVVGHFCSVSSIAAAKIYKEAGILQITPGSTSPSLTDQAAAEGNTTLFRTCGRDDAQGLAIATLLLKSHKDKKVAILHDTSIYGKGIAEETKKAMNAGGMREVLFESYTDGEKNFSPLIDRMKQAGVHIMVVGGYFAEAARLIKQSRERGLAAQMVTSGAETEDFAEIGGAATNGVMVTFPTKPENNPANAALVKKFRAAKYDPKGYTLFTYAAVKLWAEAANKTKSTNAAEVANTLRAGKWATAVGPIEFDAKGDVKNVAFDFYVWKNGKTVPAPVAGGKS